MANTHSHPQHMHAVAPLPPGNRALIGVAWTTTLLVSAIPSIAWTELTGGIPGWLEPISIGGLIMLALAAAVWNPLHPLRNYLLVFVALFGLSELRVRFDFTWPLLQTALGGSVFDRRMQAEQTGKLAVALAMAVVLLALGYRRRDFFLTRGDLRAPIAPAPLLGFRRPVAWTRFGLLWGIAIAGTLAILQYVTLRPTTALLFKVMPILPSILVYAALNAFNEEMLYRAPLLATLEPVGGSRHVLWMTAVFFGLAHYFGTPGGLAGALASIFMGWILGKGMLETRGLFWTWVIHFFSDVVIFFFMTAALLR